MQKVIDSWTKVTLMYTVEIRRTMFAMRLLRSLCAKMLGNNTLILIAAALCIHSIASSALNAQDPFASPPVGNSSAPPTTSTQSNSNNANSTNADLQNQLTQDDQAIQDDTAAIVGAIRQSNPTTAPELANAIELMLDIKREDEASRYLGQLAALTLDDEAWHEFHRKHGPAFLVRLQTNDALQPGGREFANKIFAIARKLTADPARLQGLVDKVVSGSETERLAAAGELTTIGPAGAAAMMQAFIDPGKSQSFDTFHELIRSMGSGAEPVLISAARSGNIELQKHAIRLLVALKKPTAYQTLIGLKARSKQQTDLAAPIDQALQDLSVENVTDAKLRKSLQSIIEQYLDDGSANPIEQLRYRDIWVWDKQNQSFTRKTVHASVLRRAMAADFADDLLALDNSNAHAQYLSLLSRVEANRLIVGLDQPAGSLQQLGFAEDIDPGLLKKVLSGALDRNLAGAAVATCDAYGLLAMDSALRSNEGRPSPLARALSHGNPRIRAAASQAIIRIDPTKSFAGSSQFIQSLVYLGGTMGYSKAMIAHANATESQTFAAGIARVGLISQSVNTSRDCFRDATLDSDFEVIFITDTLDYPDYAELIQQLRHDPRTRQIPIGLLARPQNMRRAELIASRDSHTLAMAWTRNPPTIAKYVDRLRDIGPQLVDPQFRIGYGKMAMDALEKYSADPARYPMYNLRSHQQEFASALLSPDFGEQACNVLGQLGSPFAQSQLVNLANQSDLPIEIREKAVSAFAEAVKRRGIMLTSTQIKIQYKRYDTSLAEKEANRKILSDILEVIEQRGQN